MNIIKSNNEYANYALGFAILSLLGTPLSILNMIPIIITYQLLQEAKKLGTRKQIMLINSLHQASMLLTLCITILYMAIQF